MKRDNIYLLIITALLILSLVMLSSNSVERVNIDRDELNAAIKLNDAFKIIKMEKLNRNIELNSIDDPSGSGIIGLDFSPITTTIGSLEAKQTTVNPHSASLIVRMLKSLNLKEGDTVALNLSGSFPALNAASIIACETLGLVPISISSVGASTYGANNPDYTWQDMETSLFEHGIIDNKSEYYSHGGDYDLGTNMDSEVLNEIDKRLAKNDYKLLHIEDFDENIIWRFDYYNLYGASAFINVGGNLISLGHNSNLGNYSNGIIDSLPVNESGDGLIQKFLKEDIPVVQLLNINELYSKYNLPIAPIKLETPGQSEFFSNVQYNKTASILLLIISFISLCLYGKKFNKIKYSYHN